MEEEAFDRELEIESQMQMENDDIRHGYDQEAHAAAASPPAQAGPSSAAGGMAALEGAA